MPTDKQIHANRENALHSTGPRTPEGKARSAANRTSHALTGRHAILPTESVEDFDNLLASLREEWDPQTETENQQVELIGHNWWRLLRIARLENDAFTRPLETRQRLSYTDDIERISRYEVRVRRAYNQAIETLRKTQSLRRPPAKPVEKKNVKTKPIPPAGPPPCPVPPISFLSTPAPVSHPHPPDQSPATAETSKWPAHNPSSSNK